jgi:hypothetical protein
MSRHEDLNWGIRLDLLMGAIYSALAVLIYAFSGSGRFDSTGISVGALFLLYFLGGMAAGVVLGSFRSALEERNSAFVVAALASLPISLEMTVLLTGKISNWSMREWTTTALMSLLLAAMGISVLWNRPE